MRDFGASDEHLLTALIVSVYVLGLAAGPLLVVPLSKIFGRLVVTHLANGGFLGFTMGCSFAASPVALIIFRFFAGAFGTAALANGPGVIADVITPDNRAVPQGIYSAFRVVGFAIGPIFGILVGGGDGNWQRVFQVQCYAAVVVLMATATFCRETYGPVVLQRKVDRRRRETGNQLLRSRLDSGLTPWQVLRTGMSYPFRIFFAVRECVAYATLVSAAYGMQYTMLTTADHVFSDLYRDIAPTSGGWYFLALALGYLSGLLVDWVAGEKGPARHRDTLVLALAASTAVVFVSLVIYGWLTQRNDGLSDVIFFCLYFTYVWCWVQSRQHMEKANGHVNSAMGTTSLMAFVHKVSPFVEVDVQGS